MVPLQVVVERVGNPQPVLPSGDGIRGAAVARSLTVSLGRRPAEALVPGVEEDVVEKGVARRFPSAGDFVETGSKPLGVVRSGLHVPFEILEERHIHGAGQIQVTAVGRAGGIGGVEISILTRSERVSLRRGAGQTDGRNLQARIEQRNPVRSHLRIRARGDLPRPAETEFPAQQLVEQLALGLQAHDEHSRTGRRTAVRRVETQRERRDRSIAPILEEQRNRRIHLRIVESAGACERETAEIHGEIRRRRQRDAAVRAGVLVEVVEVGEFERGEFDRVADRRRAVKLEQTVEVRRLVNTAHAGVARVVLRARGERVGRGRPAGQDAAGIRRPEIGRAEVDARIIGDVRIGLDVSRCAGARHIVISHSGAIDTAVEDSTRPEPRAGRSFRSCRACCRHAAGQGRARHEVSPLVERGRDRVGVFGGILGVLAPLQLERNRCGHKLGRHAIGLESTIARDAQREAVRHELDQPGIRLTAADGGDAFTVRASTVKGHTEEIHSGDRTVRGHHLVSRDGDRATAIVDILIEVSRIRIRQMRVELVSAERQLGRHGAIAVAIAGNGQGSAGNILGP